jgi:transposase
MKFKELRDAEWKFIKLQLPPPVLTGKQTASRDRKKINGVGK